jgi:hypothetical protein
VYFFKQWHLGPGVNTRTSKGSHPQEKNLESIYLQLEEWIRAKKLSELIAEGCSGTLDEKTHFRVNGWTVKDLMAETASPSFQRIATSVPMKLEAKFGESVLTVCGDSDELVKEQLLAFSDARGDAG